MCFICYRRPWIIRKDQLQDVWANSALQNQYPKDILLLSLQTVEDYVASIATAKLFIAAMFVKLLYTTVVVKHIILEIYITLFLHNKLVNYIYLLVFNKLKFSK